MRLLNTQTYILQEFVGEVIPNYAILSHRWEDEEVTYQDLQEIQKGGQVQKKGYSKIEGCCERARSDCYSWVWIDSCCIDKGSSAELSEAINSMFKWYEQAEVCYAYLSDISDTWFPSENRSNGSDGASKGFFSSPEAEFQDSKWFTRGWTLQELLAPRHLIFFNKHWRPIGSRYEKRAAVSIITGIVDIKNFREASIAQKMSWMAKRETTRIEDRAYSLLGIFGVNMPPIYGEGQNAFLRLQLEILKISDDESIFAWQDDQDMSGGLLARSPNAFKHSGSIYRHDFESDRQAYLMTNKGLRMEASLLPSSDPSSLSEYVDDTFLVALNCALQMNIWNRRSDKRLAIRLRRIERDQFARIPTNELITLDPNLPEAAYTSEELTAAMQPVLQRENIFHVKQRGDADAPFRGPYVFQFHTSTMIEKGFTVSRRHLKNRFRCRWDEDVVGGERLTTDTLSALGMAAALEITLGSSDRFFVIVSISKYQAAVAIKRPEDVNPKEIFGDAPEFGSALELPCSTSLRMRMESSIYVSVELLEEKTKFNGKTFKIQMSPMEIRLPKELFCLAAN